MGFSLAMGGTRTHPAHPQTDGLPLVEVVTSSSSRGRPARNEITCELVFDGAPAPPAITVAPTAHLAVVL